MSDHLPSPSGPRDPDKQPEVRLELTRAGVEQVLSLYSQEQGARREAGGFTLRFEDIERAIRERRQMLVVGLLAGLVVGALIVTLSSPLYAVSAQVVLERRDAPRSASAESAGSAGSAFIATQAEIMGSRSVVEAAVASLPRPGHLEPEADATKSALEAVVATPVSGTQVVSLGYLGPDAPYGIRLLEAIVEQYRKTVGELERQSQQEKLSAKQVELDLLDQEVAELEKKLDALRSANDVAGTGDDAAEAQSAVLRDQAQQLAQVRSQRIELETRLASGSEQLAILDPATKELQDQLWRAEAELERIQLTLMPQHPAVEAAQRNVDALRKQLAATAGATPAALRRDLQATRALERELEAAERQERGRMGRLEGYRREEKTLVAELEKVREMADVRRNELIDHRLLTRLAEAGEVGVSARIIAAPALPEEATWPRTKLIVAACALLGLGVGFVAALISLQRSRPTWSPPAGATTAEVQIR